MIINAEEHGFCRTWDISTNSLRFADEIVSLVDKGNCAVEFRTFNILQQTELDMKFCFIV